jgi:hypothetical protein
MRWLITTEDYFSSFLKARKFKLKASADSASGEGYLVYR